MPLSHSDKAKAATRKAVDGWIKEVQKGIDAREKELAKFKKLAPLTPSDWDDKMIPKLEAIIVEFKKKKQYYVDLKAEYAKQGLI